VLVRRNVIMITATNAELSVPNDRREEEASAPAYQAFQLLHLAFVAAPVIMGADKFLNLLTNWEKYLAPSFLSLSPFSASATMHAVGVVEIVAGLVVLFRPRIGAYVVAAWLAGIIVNLLLVGGYYDVALRDFGLCIGALALARLSATYDRRGVRRAAAHVPGRTTSAAPRTEARA
jgi:hypothetical protein